MSSDHPGTRRAATGVYAKPASHKGYSAYSRETYTGSELQYRGKTAPTPQVEEPKPCEQPS